MTIEVFVFATGAVLLLIGIIGGGFEISVVKIPHVSWVPRILTFVTGVIFILVGLGINIRDTGYGKVSDVKVIQQPSEPVVQPQPTPQATPQAQVQAVDHTIPLQSPSTPGTLTEQVKANLISAIRYADQVEISALQTLNAEVLENAFTGEALRMEKLTIESLKANNQVQYSTLNGQQFLNFKMSEDGLRAEVKVIENWSTYYYSLLTKECLGRFPDHDVPQTVYLVRTSGGWIVETIVHETAAPANIQPCN